MKQMRAGKTAEQSPAGSKASQQQQKEIFFSNNRLGILLGVIVFIVYANTLSNDYALDDYTVLRNNSYVTQGIRGIPEILSTPYRRAVSELPNDLYRPLSLLTFAIEYQVYGANPQVSHFINVVLFAGCVLLLFLFLNTLFEEQTAMAFTAALLFALHPIHTEVVANIKGRDELLCFFFALLSLRLFTRYMRSGKGWHIFGGALCFFLSMLSKETVITFLALVPLIFLFYKSDNKKRGLYITASVLMVAAIGLAIRFCVLHAYHADKMGQVDFIDNILAGAPSAGSRLATAVLILGRYLKLLFIPFPLLCDYGYRSITLVSFSDFWVLVSLLIYLLLFSFSLKYLFGKERTPIGFGIIFFLVTLSVTSNIPFLIGAAMAERFLFFPSMGFCVAIAWLLGKIKVTKTAADNHRFNMQTVAIAVICSVYAVLTISRNADWKDNTTLFATDLKKAPEDARLNYLLGNNYIEIVYPEEADPDKKQQLLSDGVGLLHNAIGIYPRFAVACSDLGWAYLSVHNYDSAEYYYQKALSLDPSMSDVAKNLAAVYMLESKFTEATGMLTQAISRNPGDPMQYAALGVCYERQQKYDSAIYSVRTSLQMDANVPASYPVYETLARAYNGLNRTDFHAMKYEAMARATNQHFKL